MNAMKKWRENGNEEPMESLKIPKATWMADKEPSCWPGTWTTAAPEHSRGDHASIIQVIINLYQSHYSLVFNIHLSLVRGIAKLQVLSG